MTKKPTKFTETFLKNLDRKDAGKVVADASYSGNGSFIARVAKSGRVSFYVKFQDPSAASGQRKVLLNDRHPLLKHHGIRAFLEEHGVGDLRKLAELDPSLTRFTEALPGLPPPVVRQGLGKLQELRLSIFAPELRPHEKISAQRFERWLAERRPSS